LQKNTQQHFGPAFRLNRQTTVGGEYFRLSRHNGREQGEKCSSFLQRLARNSAMTNYSASDGRKSAAVCHCRETNTGHRQRQ